MQTDLMNTLRWLRVIGDTVFAAALGLGWFVAGLRGRSRHAVPDQIHRG